MDFLCLDLKLPSLTSLTNLIYKTCNFQIMKLSVSLGYPASRVASIFLDLSRKIEGDSVRRVAWADEINASTLLTLTKESRFFKENALFN